MNLGHRGYNLFTFYYYPNPTRHISPLFHTLPLWGTHLFDVFFQISKYVYKKGGGQFFSFNFATSLS